ncbi:MAG: type II secretion system major pseudopilin GspG [Aeoliella sp.]
MQRPRRRSHRYEGFTLIELLLVLAILVVLGSMAVTIFGGTQDRADRDAAKSQIGIFKSAVDLYKHHYKNYPSKLEDLIEKPSDSDVADEWVGALLDVNKIPDDPWGNPYRIAAPGKKKADTYDLWSLGPDGQDGTDDDIGNWQD